MSERTNVTQLPPSFEIREMLGKESSRRAKRFDFLEMNPGIFTELRNVAAQARAYDRVVSDWQAMSLDDVMGSSMNLVDELDHYLSDETTWQNAKDLYAPLNLQIEPKESDLIFVFGSAINARVDKAIELYRAGIASKIMTTGLGSNYSKQTMSEGRLQADYAISEGIPAEAIIVEECSITTSDNVKRSFDMWQDMDWKPTRVTLVTSEFHLLRAYADMYKFADYDIEIYTASPMPTDDLNEINWIKSEFGRRVILNEYAKLIMGSKVDQVLTEESVLPKKYFKEDT